MRSRHGHVLLAGTGTYLRNLDTVVLTAILNAAVQALVVWAVPVESAGRPALWAGTLLSLLVWLATVSVFAVMGVEGAGRRVGAVTMYRATWRVLRPTMLWSGAVVVAVALALAVFTWLALVVAFALACVPVAAAAGDSFPLRSGVRSVGHHAGRLLLLGLLAAVIWLPLGVFVGLWSVLLPTPLAPFLVTGVVGVVLAWALACLAAIHAATSPASRDGQETAPTTSGELAV